MEKPTENSPSNMESDASGQEMPRVATSQSSSRPTDSNVEPHIEGDRGETAPSPKHTAAVAVATEHIGTPLGSSQTAENSSGPHSFKTLKEWQQSVLKRVKEKEEEVEKKTKALEKACQERVKLQKANDQMRRRIAEMRSCLDAQKQKNDELAKTMQELWGHNDLLSKSICATNADLGEAAAAMTACYERSEEMINEFTTMAVETEDSKKAFQNEYDQREAEHGAAIEKLLAKKLSQTELLKEKEKMQNELTARLATGKADIQKNEKHEASVKSAIESMKERIKESEHHSAQMRLKFTEKRTWKEQELAAYAAKRKQHNMDIQKMKKEYENQCSQAASQLAELNTEKAKLQALVETRTEKVEQLMQEKGVLENKKQEHLDKYVAQQKTLEGFAGASEELKEANAEREALLSDIEEIKCQTDSLLQVFDAEKKQTKEDETALADLRQNLIGQSAKIDVLEDQLTKEMSTLNITKEEVQDMKKEQHKQQEKIANLKVSIDELNKSNAEKDMERLQVLNNLEQKIRSFESNNSKLIDELAFKKKQFETDISDAQQEQQRKTQKVVKEMQQLYDQQVQLFMPSRSAEVKQIRQLIDHTECQIKCALAQETEILSKMQNLKDDINISEKERGTITEETLTCADADIEKKEANVKELEGKLEKIKLTLQQCTTKLEMVQKAIKKKQSQYSSSQGVRNISNSTNRALLTGSKWSLDSLRSAELSQMSSVKSGSGYKDTQPKSTKAPGKKRALLDLNVNQMCDSSIDAVK